MSVNDSSTERPPPFLSYLPSLPQPQPYITLTYSPHHSIIPSLPFPLYLPHPHPHSNVKFTATPHAFPPPPYPSHPSLKPFPSPLPPTKPSLLCFPLSPSVVIPPYYGNQTPYSPPMPLSPSSHPILHTSLITPSSS